jgi:leucyl aminopeptidase
MLTYLSCENRDYYVKVRDFSLCLYAYFYFNVMNYQLLFKPAITATLFSKKLMDCFVLPVFENIALSELGVSLNEKTQGTLVTLLERGDLTNELGHTLLLPHLPGLQETRILCVYCGNKTDFQELSFRKVITSAASVLNTANVQNSCFDIEGFSTNSTIIDKTIRATIELLETTHYEFTKFKTQHKPRSKRLESVHFYLANTTQQQSAEQAIQQGLALTIGMNIHRDLSNHPANHLSPQKFAQQILALFSKESTITVEILEKNHEVVAQMGAFLAVAQGSQEPPKFVVIHYRPPYIKAKQAPIVLVGKGVTFDSGGISIKPSAKMEEMKFDMAGAASVVGTLKAAATLNLPIPLIGVLPLTENLPSGTAIKPGDVVKTLSGQTVEILNTDAEGRLILADALTYSEQFNPAVVLDIATLTGAMVVALGPVATGLMSNHEALARDLERAGQKSGDRVWPFPLWEDYQEFIKSNVADIANIGDGSGAGSITAACFLSRFTKKFERWAHLDIAGTAWKSGKDKTATGRPVPLLLQYLLDYCEKQ